MNRDFIVTKFQRKKNYRLGEKRKSIVKKRRFFSQKKRKEKLLQNKNINRLPATLNFNPYRFVRGIVFEVI